MERYKQRGKGKEWRDMNREAKERNGQRRSGEIQTGRERKGGI